VGRSQAGSARLSRPARAFGRSEAPPEPRLDSMSREAQTVSDVQHHSHLALKVKNLASGEGHGVLSPPSGACGSVCLGDILRRLSFKR